MNAHSGGGGHSGQSGHSGDGSGFGHANQQTHHSSNIGNLSNDVMMGTYFEHWTFTNFIEGLKINMGMRFAVLFIAFAGWLYVIYWIRHHEPFANQAIGVQSTLAPTAMQDRNIVAAIRNAFPLRTSPNMGQLYVPSPQPPTEATLTSEGSNQNNYNQTNAYGQPNHSIALNKMVSGPGQAISSPVEYPKTNIDQRFGLPTNLQIPAGYSLYNSNPPIVSNDPILSNTQAVVPNQSPSTYQIRINNGQSNLLRTVVNR